MYMLQNTNKFLNLFKKGNNKKIILSLLFILLVFLSLFPRSVEVLNGNPVFGFDQGREMLAAKNIIINHKPILIGTELGAGSAGISGIFQGPAYYYLLTIPFVLFNGNPAGSVWLMLFFGLLSIIFGAYLGYKIFGKRGGILVTLLMAISPILIGQSRFIWSPYPPTFFILLSFYFTYFLKKRNLNVFFASFFAGFIYNFELAIAVPLSIALALYSIFIFRGYLRKYIYLFLGFLISYSPMFFFELRHGFMGLKGIIIYLTVHKNVSGKSLTSFVPEHAQSFIYNFKDTFPVNDFNFSLLFFIVLLLVFVYLLIKEKNNELKYFFSFLLLLVPVSFFVFSLLRNTVWSYYLTELDLGYILLLTYIIVSLQKFKDVKINILLIIFIGSLTMLGLYSSISTTLHDYSDYGGGAKLKGKEAAIDYIYKNAKGKPFGLLVFTPPVYTYPYDYLVWWYGEKKYHYIPHNKKKGTFYLLIEPDSEKPWSYKGWLETVIKSGKIESTVTLPSGLIVQKRFE